MTANRNQVQAWQLSAAIRDAVGLEAEQKAFLWCITSHTNLVERGARDLVMQRTGLSDHKFRRVVRFLEEHRLIRVERADGKVTQYTLRYGELTALKKANNPVAVANMRTRRQAPTSAHTTPPSRSPQSTRGAGQHPSPVGSRQPKNTHEVEPEELSKNRRVVIVRRSRTGAASNTDDDELDIFK
ncbi:hypothetical protein [Microbacterium testaceum]|uniref:hypothetical protein n=1 Tax=Microbacterium testaceum TaxID=2033 RepID=UPI0022E18BE6|nr:hypothetical protein [Microbacterium testaceum]